MALIDDIGGEILATHMKRVSARRVRVYAGHPFARLPGEPWARVDRLAATTYEPLTASFRITCGKHWILLRPTAFGPAAVTHWNILPATQEFGWRIDRTVSGNTIGFSVITSDGVAFDGADWWFPLQAGKVGLCLGDWRAKFPGRLMEVSARAVALDLSTQVGAEVDLDPTTLIKADQQHLGHTVQGDGTTSSTWNMGFGTTVDIQAQTNTFRRAIQQFNTSAIASASLVELFAQDGGRTDDIQDVLEVSFPAAQTPISGPSIVKANYGKLYTAYSSPSTRCTNAWAAVDSQWRKLDITAWYTSTATFFLGYSHADDRAGTTGDACGFQGEEFHGDDFSPYLEVTEGSPPAEAGSGLVAFRRSKLGRMFDGPPARNGDVACRFISK